MICGSTPSSSRVNTAFADCQTMPKMSDGDGEPYDRVGERVAEPHAERAQHHGEARQPVDARVVAIGDQRRAVDLAAHPDAEHGHSLVAEEADHPGDRDPAE